MRIWRSATTKRARRVRRTRRMRKRRRKKKRKKRKTTQNRQMGSNLRFVAMLQTLLKMLEVCVVVVLDGMAG